MKTHQTDYFEEVLNFIQSENLPILKLNDNKNIHRVKLARLNHIDNRRSQKDFTFEFLEDKFYYIFITIEENENFCKFSVPNKKASSFLYSSNSKKQFPYFNFDYNKYLVNLNVCHKEEEEMKLFKINLNRETTVVSHSNLESIDYYKEVKNVKPTDNSSMNIDKFSSLLENFFIIEIESRKNENEVSMKEDGILNVLYILSQEKEDLIEIYTLIKYSNYYIKEVLINYISKYIYDLIFDFTHLPNETLLKFLENFGVILTKNDTQKIIFPLKQKVKSFRHLYFENKINYLNVQIPNIKKAKNFTSVPFYRFVKLINKYDYYNSEKELKIKQSYLRKKKKYSYLSVSCMIDENTDQISKERRINLNTALKDFMNKINRSLKEYNISNLESVENFLLSSLNKYLIKHTFYKGFINIDIILNEDSMVDLQCCKKKKLNSKFNIFTFQFLSKCLNCCNLFFDFNEGFFHKHFDLLDFTYNFNEKNIIHTFPSAFDSSKKNKIRIFDIPLLESWTTQIANLILLIWKDSNNLLNFENIEADHSQSLDKFLQFFASTINMISGEFFELYEEALPDFYLFCKGISKFPLNKYNCIDNLCQHFTNSSIQTLLKNNLIFFSPLDVVYNIDKETFSDRVVLSYPNLDTIIEPYLIYIDKELFEYIEVKEKKEAFLEKKNLTLENYIQLLKNINSEKINYNLILGHEKMEKSIRKPGQIELNINVENLGNNYIESPVEEDLTLIESHTLFLPPEKFTYNFSFLLNLSHFFRYKLIIDIKEKLVHYCIMKRFINSMEASQSLSFDKLDGSVLQNTPKNKAVVKNQCKRAKAILFKNLETMTKVKSYNENMLLVFYNYLKSLSLKINQDKKLPKDKNTFIKVGYFLVNLRSVSEDNPVPKFYESEYYYNFSNY